MPNLAIQPATAPVDAPFPPASAQALLNFVAAYLQVSGLQNLTGVIRSTTTPVAADRDKAWLKLDPANLRPIGMFVFTSGEWIAVPLVVESGDAKPAGAKKGELFYDAQSGLQIYDGSQWTTNTFPSGTTADRPKGVPVNYFYLDTDIARLLRYTTQGWTTIDGAIGDIKMVDTTDEDDAELKNPGWTVLTGMGGKFPIGASTDYGAGTEGGRSSIAWSAKGTAAAGGSRESPAIGAIAIDDKEIVSTPNRNNTPTAIDSGTFKIIPPYKALIFLRKDF